MTDNPKQIQHRIRLLVFSAKWGLAVLMLGMAFHLKDPYLLRVREYLSAGIVLFCLVTGGITLYQIRKHRRSRLREIERTLFCLMLIAIIFSAGIVEIDFQYTKHTVLHAEPEQLQRLGRHFIVGYRRAEEILPLITQGAISGIYMTKRNVGHRTFDEIRQEIATFQQLRSSFGLPPLLIAADQEGGIVSHFSPPLKRLPPLSSLARYHAFAPPMLDTQVQAYAHTHGKELNAIGVNLNLSPVVDLKIPPEQRFRDLHSRIPERAISKDPALVSQMALTYSQTLERCGVISTVKHFPGLAGVAADTHHASGALNMSVRQLQRRDWIPFQQVVAHSNAFLMLSHVTLPDVDPDYPVSYSHKVIQGILREQWQHDGVLITDDFTMQPIYRSQEGIGHATVTALNAGVDLILISYDGEQYYKAMHAVIRADRHGELEHSTLQQSREHLERAIHEVIQPELFTKGS
jgi:beta-N-acetylhexosaminidase